MSLAALLPKPVHSRKTAIIGREIRTRKTATSTIEPPAYGKRNGFKPTTPADFGDGGAFPEIPTLQYPLDMGRKDKRQGKVVPLTIDAEGNVKYSLIARQGHDKSKTVHSTLRDMVAREVAEDQLQKPSADETRKQLEAAKKRLSEIVGEKVSAAQPTHVKKQNLNEATFIRYTPGQQGAQYNSGAKQRVIRVQEMPVDPLDPPKFKHKKIPNGPPSPPVPVMHSPPRKITVQDQQNWKIPPCISNWKNIKGYIIPLDKRLAADGRSLQEVQINDKFAKLSESLFVAERTARAEIRTRADMMKQLSRKKKEAKEDELRKLASQARREGAIAQARQREEEVMGEQETEQDVEDREEREEMRRERKRDIKRDVRMENRKAEKSGSKRPREEKERDVSEKIALGQQISKSKDSMFDQRLFNQTEGMDSGFGADDDYSLYSKPLMSGSSANQIYRPKVNQEETYGGDLSKLIQASTTKFTADRPFQGAESSGQARDKPVAFERQQQEEDPFGLGELLTTSNTTNSLDTIGKQGHMSAAGGASTGQSYSRKHSGSEKNIDFEESSSSRSSSSSSRNSSSSSRSSSSSKRRRR